MKIMNYNLSFHRREESYNISLALGFTEDKKPSDKFLTLNEKKLLEAFSGQRASEFIYSRYLIKETVVKNEQQISKNDIEIVNGVFGQPILTIKKKSVSYGTSISHKPNLIGCVVYDQRHPVGIDIEELNLDNANILYYEMSDNEKRMLTKEFDSICIWTAKEALSKVLNCGMTVSFQLFETSKFICDNNKCTGQFLHFPHYKFESFKMSEHIITLVFPSRSNLKINNESLQYYTTECNQ